MKVVIIGGVAGGATFLGRYRRLNENDEIVMFEKGKYVSFANCGLPYYVGGTIKSRNKLFITTKEAIEKKYKAKINLSSEVIKINRDKKTVSYIKNGSNDIFEESYDKLIISTGSIPNKYHIDSDVDNTFNLITIDDTDKIYSFIEKNKPKSALIIGAGFIGLEICENLIDRGLNVTLLARSQIMSKIDDDISKLVLNTLREKGVNVIFGKKAKKLSSVTVLEDDRKIDSDLIIMAVGTHPNISLLDKEDIAPNNTVKVNNDYSLTTDKDIYAIGDIIEEEMLDSSLKTYIPLANLANKQGRYIADNINSIKRNKKKSIRTSILKVFDNTLAYCGLSEKDLIKQNKVYKKDYFYTIIHPFSSATYYPNFSRMTLKLIFDNKKILGAQIYGKDGVDKRIDTIGVVMQMNGSVKDLVDLEFSYAPPYNQAKDPVNFAGYVAENILNKITDQVSIKEYLENKNKYTVIDVREKEEIQYLRLNDDFISIPLNEIRENLDKLDKNKEYLVMCAVGLRGYIAERILKQNGFKVSNLMGGILSLMQELS